MECRDAKDLSFLDFEISWDKIKSNAHLRVINEKYLPSYDENIAHLKLLDLVMTISIQKIIPEKVSNKSKDVMHSHMLTNDELKELEVDFYTALESAIANTTHDRKRRILRFGENLLRRHPFYPIARIPEGMMLGIGQNEPGVIVDHDPETDDDNVLIICNKRDAYASAYIAIPKVLETVYDRFKENFYIVPMSVHEVMCVRSTYATDDGNKSIYEAEDDLKDMVETMNNNSKSWKDILSYKIYYYAGDDGKHLLVI